MDILFLSRWYPYPPDNGSKIRVYNLLSGLARFHDVTLISFYEKSDPEPVLDHMRNICREVHIVQRKGFDPNSLRALVGFFSLRPRSFIDAYSTEMRDRIEYTLHSSKFDCIVASQVDMAAYVDLFDSIPAIFEEAELGVLRERFTQAESLPVKARHWLTWIKHRSFVNELVNKFDLSTVVSEREHHLLSQISPKGMPIAVIPNCINLDHYNNIRPDPKVETLVFCGSITYQPNYEGVIWFLEEVYPLLRRNHPNIMLIITGERGNRLLPDQHGVTLTGYIDDIRPVIANTWCSIVPLHIGGGTRLKILEAMALHTPVVSTTKGAEGLDVEDGEHLLLADDPIQFAEAVECILKSSNLRQELTDNAYNLLREKYDWAVVMPHFLKLIDKVTGINPLPSSSSVGSGEVLGLEQ